MSLHVRRAGSLLQCPGLPRTCVGSVQFGAASVWAHPMIHHRRARLRALLFLLRHSLPEHSPIILNEIDRLTFGR